MTRPGKWGNPFRVGGWFRWEVDGTWSEAPRSGAAGYVEIADRAMAVEWFARLMETRPVDLAELRGKNLACWCRPGEPCHADVLLRLANDRVSVAK